MRRGRRSMSRIRRKGGGEKIRRVIGPGKEREQNLRK